MPEKETREPQNENPEVVLAHWQDRLKILVDKVKVWVEKAGWRTRTIEKPMNDRNLGRHTVPVLLMEKDTVEVALNPVSPLVSGARGPSTSTWCRPTTTSPAFTSRAASG